MKITNKHNYPQAFVNYAIAQLQKPENDYIRVTSLCDSPQILRLKKAHWEALEVDVSTKTWALISTAIHEILQAYSDANTLTEERLIIEVDGVKIGGRPDIFDHYGNLQDWKCVKTGKLFMGMDREIEQLNCYAYMLRQHGFEVNKIQDIFIFRDWMKPKADVKADYPDYDVRTYDQPLWSEEQQLAFIRERIRVHQEPDSLCDDKDRWARPTVYAVMKKGKKRSEKNHKNKIDAERHVINCNQSDKANKYYIDERIGEPFYRCRNGYCDVSQVCGQFY